MPRKEEITFLQHMPQRLRELRQELGWSLSDVAQRIGLAQRSVVSNWEATSMRRRIPDIENLLALQRWYGVSLDYLVGEPGAERDSPAVKLAKDALVRSLAEAEDVKNETASGRARVAVRLAIQLAPEVFFPERISVWLFVSPGELDSLLHDAPWPDPLLNRLGALLGVPAGWFSSPDPAECLRVESYLAGNSRMGLTCDP